MRKFLITLILSGIIISGIWVIPELNKESLPQSAEQVERVKELNPFEHRQGMYDPNNMQLDTIPIEGGVIEGTVIEPPMMLMSAEKEVDWQALITWIIGSLNGLFGMALLVKKIFTKS